MKAFHFNLERILNLRAYREREWELKLAEATGRCVRLRREIDADLKRKAAELTRRFERTLNPQVLDISNRYVARLEQQISANESRLTYAEEARNEVQRKFLEAQRDRKVLDKLKERKSEAFIKEERLEEVAEIDDMNTERSAFMKHLGGSGG